MGLALIYFQKYWLLIDRSVQCTYLSNACSFFWTSSTVISTLLDNVQKLKRQLIKVIGTNTYGIYKFSHTKQVKQKIFIDMSRHALLDSTWSRQQFLIFDCMYNEITLLCFAPYMTNQWLVTTKQSQ